MQIQSEHSGAENSGDISEFFGNDCFCGKLTVPLDCFGKTPVEVGVEPPLISLVERNPNSWTFFPAIADEQCTPGFAPFF